MKQDLPQWPGGNGNKSGEGVWKYRNRNYPS